ncbi:uncharacterized protein [Venturia canescens]|uniref:uncharacterized protein n=1 Tax=Venturia canescens TaxID=32260 RepID=UPI001C9CBDCA|nr:uncharacterized protein LOC122409613 [Venturia canescens]XP_043273250.1 uncharacterized protein LOC122409613 [Venturia canescens]XP_043273251.1 uncharacterized protein LOC122409613 [Venturia canescens]XP_043273252.1 uncharacterized protein LOC122409613 [Venturia canescens]XP_043273253.1 uncharacterized protein LOC122409613 [Venturia canescens]XP_043273254.1 uncharacterized protein LOC122409613 [Venturia canescens]XP_043273255.1 uncharacterized protein LOC122409613 [Venturia canescens]XP_0
MIATVFFGLLCLGPLNVMGGESDWLPDTIPWPAQQCIDLNLGYDGECTIAPDVRSAFYKNTSPCNSLKCALPVRGGHVMIRNGRPKDGTLCGILKACRGGKCVDIAPHKIPTQTGIQTTHDCRPRSMMPERKSNSNK